MESESVFGVEPEQLNELLSVGEDDLDDSPDENEPSPNDRSSEEKSDSEPAMNAFVERPGSWIGPYKLLRVLGEGGMGIAYLAEQKRPMRRQVAIKVIKPGMDSRRVVSRFEAERQALALLDHPNIAHVFDAGMTELGRPYFVMEYVKGLSITDYCDHHKLRIKDRLVLFQQICQAIQHAHQKGIIHRDIKPSNILVSVENDRPTPKIIDFGVAKAIGRPLTDRTVFTEDSHLLGTPEYMSPEQADMATEDIDTRSDVYSLGVLLYVLLTGVLPFDVHSLRDSGIEKIRKTIRETDPKTPSTRLTSLGEEAANIAEMRSTEISILTKHLKKELEWIPLKAMRKERSERYRSASELADDIENYLTGASLIAGPPTSLYRFRKFVQRNVVLSTAVLVVVVTLCLGLAGVTAMYFRAERLRVEAQEAAVKEATARAEAQAYSDFFEIDILQDASFSEGMEFSLDYILNIATKKLEDRFWGQPTVEARIRERLGKTYKTLGKLELAIDHLKRAYKIRVQQLGPEDPNTQKTAHMLCWAYRNQGRYDDAIRLWNELIEIERKAHGHDDATAVLYMYNIASVYTHLGRYEEAEALLGKAMEITERATRYNYFLLLGNLYTARNCLEQGRYDAAERHCLAIIGPEPIMNTVSPQGAANCRILLGETYQAKGRYEQAECIFNELIDAKNRQRPVPELAKVYVCQERFGEAEGLFKKAIEGGSNLPPGRRHLILDAMNGLAVLYTKQAKFDEAASLFKQVWEERRLTLGDDHPRTLETINDLGVLYRKQKNYEQAESLLDRALKDRHLKLGPDHPATLDSMHELAILYREQVRYEEAETLLREAVEGRRLKLGDTHPHTKESLNNLVQLYEAWNKPEKAEEWLAKLEQIEDFEE